MDNRTQLLIESYFAGTLSDAEKREFQELLATDNAAAAEFAWQQKLAKQVSKLSLGKSIQNDTWRGAAKPPFRKITMTRTIWAAAAAIALLAVAYFFLPNLLPVDKEAVLAESFAHFPNKMRFKNLGGDAEMVSVDVLDAFAAYDQQNYELAVPKLIEVVNANPTRLEYRFYLGVAQLGRKKYADAINALFAVTQDKNSPYCSPAHYYIGVAYAQINDVKQAKTHLNAYLGAQDGVKYQDQAKKLLRALK